MSEFTIYELQEILKKITGTVSTGTRPEIISLIRKHITPSNNTDTNTTVHNRLQSRPQTTVHGRLQTRPNTKIRGHQPAHDIMSPAHIRARRHKFVDMDTIDYNKPYKYLNGKGKYLNNGKGKYVNNGKGKRLTARQRHAHGKQYRHGKYGKQYPPLQHHGKQHHLDVPETKHKQPKIFNMYQTRLINKTNRSAKDIKRYVNSKKPMVPGSTNWELFLSGVGPPKWYLPSTYV